MDDRERYEQGMTVRRAVLGDAHVVEGFRLVQAAYEKYRALGRPDDRALLGDRRHQAFGRELAQHLADRGP